MASSTQVETVTSGADKAKMGAAVALVIAALAGFYLLARQGQIVQWAVLVVGLIAAVAVFFTSLPGKEFVGFGRDAWKEVRKVVWPARKEAIQMTLYVFGFVVVMALFLWLTDKTLEWVFYDLILGWKQ
jgi:preprotein translocase subunit SecE